MVFVFCVWKLIFHSILDIEILTRDLKGTIYVCIISVLVHNKCTISVITTLLSTIKILNSPLGQLVVSWMKK